MVPGWLWSGLVMLAVNVLLSLVAVRLVQPRASKRVWKTVNVLTTPVGFGVAGLLCVALGLMSRAEALPFLVGGAIVGVALGASTWVSTTND